MRNLFYVSLLALALQACVSTPRPPLLKPQWVGIFTAKSTRLVDEPTSLTGKRQLATGWALLHATHTVPAAIGTKFGIAHTFESERPNELVRYSAVWKFPKPGLFNPKTGKLTLMTQSNLECRAGSDCLIAHIFDEQRELVIGTWVLEIWLNGSLLQREEFEVVPP